MVELDTRAIIDGLKADYAHWSYINENRLYELLTEHGLDPTKSRYFDRVNSAGVVDAHGIPLPVNPRFYKYEGPNILIRYAFMKSLLMTLLDSLYVENISDYLDGGVLRTALAEGDFVFVQGKHVFSSSAVKRGPGQTCRATRSTNKVAVTFSFDRWEATSSSSKNDWLVGTKSAGSLLQLKSIDRVDGSLVLTGMVLAISACTRELKTRSYGDFG